LHEIGELAVPISDVAKCAGVSRTTVSHVLSGKRPVSKAVTERVQRAMRELGYVPSRAAQSLASGTTHTLGLLVPDLRNGFFAELVLGAEHAAIERGFNVLLCSTGWNLERELFYLDTLRSRAVDGVIYASGVPDHESQLAEHLADLPSVAVDEDLGALPIATVVSNNRAGGRLVAEHLAGLGHTRAVVVGANKRLASSAERAAGFKAMWKSSTGQQARILPGSFEEQCGFSAAGELIDAVRGGEVTSVFALNDLIALGILRRFREEGITVPRDCSVVGFDDIAIARHTTPGLTTVRQDPFVMGSLAVKTLLDHLLNGGVSQPERQVLPVEFVERESTAPPARREAHQWQLSTSST